MIFNCLIAGVGGQGTVLASKLIAMAAMENGYDVRTAETIGMAQRGGHVVSHIRIGQDIFSPLIALGAADALIAFEPAEAVRHLPYISERGTLILCDTVVKPVTAALANEPYNPEDMIDYLKKNYQKSIIISGNILKEQCGRTLNVAVLGFAAQSGIFPFSVDVLKNIISRISRYREQNIASYELGRKLYDEYIR